MYKTKELAESSVNKRSFLELLKKSILHVQELQNKKMTLRKNKFMHPKKKEKFTAFMSMGHFILPIKTG